MIGWLVAAAGLAGFANRALERAGDSVDQGLMQRVARVMKRQRGRMELIRVGELMPWIPDASLTRSALTSDSPRIPPSGFVLDYDWDDGKVHVRWVRAPESIHRLRGPASIWVGTLAYRTFGELADALDRAAPAIERLDELRRQPYNALEVAKAISLAAPHPNVPDLAIPVPVSAGAFDPDNAWGLEWTSLGVQGDRFCALLPFYTWRENHLNPAQKVWMMDPPPRAGLDTFRILLQSQYESNGAKWRAVSLLSRQLQIPLLKLVSTIKPGGTAESYQAEFRREASGAYGSIKTYLHTRAAARRPRRSLDDMVEQLLTNPGYWYRRLLIPHDGRHGMVVPTVVPDLADASRALELMGGDPAIQIEGAREALRRVRDMQLQERLDAHDIGDSPFGPQSVVEHAAKDIWTYAWALQELRARQRDEQRQPPPSKADWANARARNPVMARYWGGPPPSLRNAPDRVFGFDHLRLVRIPEGNPHPESHVRPVIQVRTDVGPITSAHHHGVPEGFALVWIDGDWQLRRVSGDGLVDANIGPSQFVIDAALEAILSEPSENMPPPGRGSRNDRALPSD